MSNKKPLYFVHHSTEFGMGMQPVIASNKTQARAKFKKRFTSKRNARKIYVIDKCAPELEKHWRGRAI